MRNSDDNKAESAKDAAIEASNNLKKALRAFDYNRNYTARDKTTLRRRAAAVALALSNN